MASTLVIIDMQEGFHAAHNSYTIYHVLQEIKLAKKSKAGIIIVMYERSGRLLRTIDKAITGYANVDIAWKYKNDGSEEIEQCIYDNYFSAKAIRVCGVNTDACVCETVENLAYSLPMSQIKVIEDACNSIDDNDFSWIDYLPNVELVESVKV